MTIKQLDGAVIVKELLAKGTDPRTGLKLTGTGIRPPKYTTHFLQKRYMIGKGLVEVEEPLKVDEIEKKREAAIKSEPNFGNYVISLKALKKGMLHVRYPSGANIPHFPKQLISTTFKKIINDLLFEKQFDEEDYENLDEIEKKLFDDLIIFCKADKKDGIMLYKHKKYSDKERDADIKRFNILRGELIAGNDNPSIIKELKGLLFKMMNQKNITRAEYNRIMERILIMD